MLEHAQIRAVLPHRHPILLVDRIEELEPFTRVVAVKTVTGSEPCYAGLAEDAGRAGHAYPWSLVIESFGQSGAVLWLESIRGQGRTLDGSLIFAAARDVVLHRAAHPGDTLRHVAYIDRVVADNAFLYGRTYVGDDLAAEYGSVIAVIRQTDSLSPRPPAAPRPVTPSAPTPLEQA